MTSLEINTGYPQYPPLERGTRTRILSTTKDSWVLTQKAVNMCCLLVLFHLLDCLAATLEEWEFALVKVVN